VKPRNSFKFSMKFPILRLAAILFLATQAFASTFTATLKNGTGSTLPAAYVHFQLYNCGTNVPVIASSPSTIAATMFDLTPNQSNGTLIGTVVGKSQWLKSLR
jgi:hypothetical protein